MLLKKWRNFYKVVRAQKISLKNAKENKLFYIVANCVVYRESDKRCLILKRDEREKVHPGKFGVIGGKLEWEDLDVNNPTRVNGDVLDYQDAVEKLLKREVFEEAGIEIKGELQYINSVAFIRPDEVPVLLVKFASLYKSGKVILEKGAFTDYLWVNSSEISKHPHIEGICDEIQKTEKIFELL